jgi:hypothetical protein
MSSGYSLLYSMRLLKRLFQPERETEDLMKAEEGWLTLNAIIGTHVEILHVPRCKKIRVIINEKTVLDSVINGKRVLEFATSHEPFFPFMRLVINGFFVYDSKKGFISYFINEKRVRDWLQIPRLLLHGFFLQCTVDLPKVRPNNY